MRSSALAFLWVGLGCASGGTTVDSGTETGTTSPPPPVEPVTEATFSERFAEVICDKFFACRGSTTLAIQGWSSAEDCYDQANVSTMPMIGLGDCPAFDPVAAQACFDAFAALDCLAFNAGAESFPPQCDSAVICGG
jgi:hypothetical protein